MTSVRATVGNVAFLACNTGGTNNVFAADGFVGPYGPAVADEFWVTVPLAVGNRTIHFHALSLRGGFGGRGVQV